MVLPIEGTGYHPKNNIMDRKRLAPWLRKRVNAGDFGLRWINEEEQSFSIPWRHKSNKAWVPCPIFKEWAIYTNRHQEGQPEDWPAWKQRLRSAFNKLSDFEEMPHLHNLDDLENPYRVYRFVTTPVKKAKKDPDSSPSVTGSQYTPPSSVRSQASPHFEACSPHFDALSPHFDALSPHFDALSPHFLGVDSQNMENNAWNNIVPNIPTTVGENDFLCDPQPGLNIPVPSEEMYNCGLEQSISSSVFPQELVFKSEERSMDVPSLPSDLKSIDSNNLIQDTDVSGYGTDSVDMQLQNNTQTPKIRYKIYFLDELLREGTLGEDECAHFYFGQLPQGDLNEQVFGPKGCQKLQFPDVTNIKKSINSEVTRHIQDILLKMDRGFLLQYHKGDIYAQRLCRTRIFAYNPLISSLPLDRAKKVPQKLFDFSEFKESLSASRDADIAIPPSDTVLIFGQEMKSWDRFKKLYVRLELSHVEAWELRRQCFPQSFSSGLQFSDLDSGDLFLESFMKGLNLNEECQ